MATLWDLQLARLAAYKAAHGDCHVPRSWAEVNSAGVSNKHLSNWVSMQRALKRKLDRGEPSRGMTAGRAAKLAKLGFAWDLNDTKWQAQLARLVAYKAAHGHCRVPVITKRWAEDQRLGQWVTTQRTGKRCLDSGKGPRYGMTAERAAKLTALGFEWQPYTKRIPVDTRA
jgi:hypothetical protein